MLNSSTLRPGLLVSLKTSVTGNVRYFRKDLVQTHKTEDGKEKSAWQTEKTVYDPDEHIAAEKTRSKCRALISKPCAKSNFGLLCPNDATAELDAAVEEAQKVASDFNATAKLSHVEVYVMTGTLAQDEAQAVRAINSEVRDLMATMETGLKNLDVKAVRAAAAEAKQLTQMLSKDASARVQIAVDLARKSATEMKKAGDRITKVIDTRTINRIAEQRVAFIDLDDAQEVETPAARARSVDLQAS